MTWVLLRRVISYSLLSDNGSLIEEALNASLESKEICSVKIAALAFLESACDCLMLNESIDGAEGISMSFVTTIISKISFMTRVKEVLNGRTIPALYVSGIVKFMAMAIKADFKKSLPVLT
jgi:hypothetical protein